MAKGEHTTPAPGADPVVGVEWVSSDVAVVAVSGEIDALTISSMTRVIDAALDKRPAVLVVDLTEVSFFGSAGLGALVAAEDRSGDFCTLRVVALSTVRRPIRITGLDQTLAVFPTLDEALTT